MREREEIGQDGIVLLNMEVDRKTGSLKDFEIISRGFMTPEESESLFTEMRRRAKKMIDHNAGNMQGEIKKLAQSMIFEETKRKPMVFTTITRN